MFRPYQHLERLGNLAVENIQNGKCHVFPKIDGSNGSIWLSKEGEVCAGSRNRKLSLDNDNAGFYRWVLDQENILNYLNANPTHRLFGEWLVPHALKTYTKTSWENFYIFDVTVDNGDELNFLHYDEYKLQVEQHNLNIIHPIAVIDNGDYDIFSDLLPKNVYLIEDGKGSGEGIVIKNYDFYNKFGKQIWAKLVTNDFKFKVKKSDSYTNSTKLPEEEIAEKFVTIALCEKAKAKLTVANGGWSSKLISDLLKMVYSDLVIEEVPNFVLNTKKSVTINYGTLIHFSNLKVKEILKEIF